MKILQNQFKQSAFVRNRWAIMAMAGSNPKELLKPDTWAHVSNMVRTGDIIEVTAQDGAWFAEVYVRFAKSLDVRTALLRVVVFDEEAKEVASVESGTKGKKPSAEDFEIKRYGNRGRFRVVRLSDGVSMKDDLTKVEAEMFVLEMIQ